MAIISWPLRVLLFVMGHLYLRILCASILRFWLLEHTTATRSGWLGIATPDETKSTDAARNELVWFFEPCERKYARQNRIFFRYVTPIVTLNTVK